MAPINPEKDFDRGFGFFRMEHRDGLDSVVGGATDSLAREIDGMGEGWRIPVTVKLQ